MSVTWGAFTITWIAATPAAAQESTGLDLHWEAPAGCPQERAVRERIRAIAPSVEQDLHLRAEGTITQIEGRYRLRLVVTSDHSKGERIIESTSCTELAGAAAVTLRLLAQVVPHTSEPPGSNGDARSNAQSPADGTAPSLAKPPSTETAQPATPAPANTNVAEPAPTSKPAKQDAPPPTSDQPSTRGWRLLVRVPLVAGDVGPLPSPTVGWGLGVGVRVDAWRFLLAGHLALDRTVEATSVPGYGVQVGWATAELSACRGLRTNRFELAPCATVAMERMTAQGFGAQIAPHPLSPTWLGVGADIVGYWYPSDWMAFFLNVGGRIQTSRPIVSLEVVGPIYQVAPAELTLAIGSEWIL